MIIAKGWEGIEWRKYTYLGRYPIDEFSDNDPQY
jgi:hypothetical protein